MHYVSKVGSKVLRHLSNSVEEKVVLEGIKIYKASTFDIWALEITIVIPWSIFLLEFWACSKVRKT